MGNVIHTRKLRGQFGILPSSLPSSRWASRWSHCGLYALPASSTLVATVLAASVSLSAGCLDEFKGSVLQIQIAPSVPSQTPLGGIQRVGQVPHNAHFRIVGLNEQLNEQGQVTQVSSFVLTPFEVVPVVDPSSPCFIDADPRSKLKGIHITNFFLRTQADTGITDIANPPATATENDKIDAATAQARVERAALYATTVKAVVSASAAEYPAVGAACADAANFDAGVIPPVRCIDDASNKVRLAQCTAFWQANPDFYEGNDSILTTASNGSSFGLVVGVNPVNSTPLGGATIFIDEVVAGIDSFAMYWQYDDANGDGSPDYPSDVPASSRNSIGQQYMFGKPRQVTRGTRYVSLQSSSNSTIKAEMTFITNLGEDNVTF